MSAKKKNTTTVIAEAGTDVVDVKYTVINLTDTEVPFFVLRNGMSVLTRLSPYKSIVVGELTDSIKKLSSGSKKLLDVLQE